MQSKCELQTLYLQRVYAKLQYYSSNGEWTKKNFLTRMIKTATIPILIPYLVQEDKHVETNVKGFRLVDLFKIMLTTLA